MDIYPKRGIWYAPKWRNPSTGDTTPAHSLGTADRAEAEKRWTLEQARAISGDAPPPKKRAAHDFARALYEYVRRKVGSVADCTLDTYLKQGVRLMDGAFGNPPLDAFEGAAGTDRLQAWATAEVARLGGRTHGVVKRIESIIKPALRLAHHRWGEPARLPLWPTIVSDYRGVGARKVFLTRAQFAAMRAELPEVDKILFRDGRAPIFVYPRLWSDITISTGMHSCNVDQFIGADWTGERALWFRRNTKGEAFYPAAWFPCDAYLQARLAEVWRQRNIAPRQSWVADLIVGDEPDRLVPLPEGWMSHRLAVAAKRAGLPFAPLPIDLRRTYATWRREEGWEFEDVSRVLANSTGMVREVYAQVPAERFAMLVGERSAPQAQELQRLAESASSARVGPQAAPPAPRRRRGPRRADGVLENPGDLKSPNPPEVGSESGSKSAQNVSNGAR